MVRSLGSELDLQYTATLIPAIWRQVCCKSSVDAMLEFVGDDDDDEGVAALRGDDSMKAASTTESSEEIRN